MKQLLTFFFNNNDLFLKVQMRIMFELLKFDLFFIYKYISYLNFTDPTHHQTTIAELSDLTIKLKSDKSESSTLSKEIATNLNSFLEMDADLIAKWKTEFQENLSWEFNSIYGIDQGKYSHENTRRFNNQHYTNGLVPESIILGRTISLRSFWSDTIDIKDYTPTKWYQARVSKVLYPPADYDVSHATYAADIVASLHPAFYYGLSLSRGKKVFDVLKAHPVNDVDSALRCIRALVTRHVSIQDPEQIVWKTMAGFCLTHLALRYQTGWTPKATEILQIIPLFYELSKNPGFLKEILALKHHVRDTPVVTSDGRLDFANLDKLRNYSLTRMRRFYELIPDLAKDNNHYFFLADPITGSKSTADDDDENGMRACLPPSLLIKEIPPLSLVLSISSALDLVDSEEEQDPSGAAAQIMADMVTLLGAATTTQQHPPPPPPPPTATTLDEMAALLAPHVKTSQTTTTTTTHMSAWDEFW